MDTNTGLVSCYYEGKAMTETQLILHLRTVMEIACRMLEEGKTKEVQELLSDALKETSVPVWRERVIYPHVK